MRVPVLLAEKYSSVNTVLDRHSAKFSLNPEETQRHWSLMWEIYTYDSWVVCLFRVLRHWLAEVLTELDTARKSDGPFTLPPPRWSRQLTIAGHKAQVGLGMTANCAHLTSFQCWPLY